MRSCKDYRHRGRDVVRNLEAVALVEDGAIESVELSRLAVLGDVVGWDGLITWLVWDSCQMQR